MRLIENINKKEKICILRRLVSVDAFVPSFVPLFSNSPPNWFFHSLEIPEAAPKTFAIPECPSEFEQEEAASIGEINYCLRYQSSLVSFKLPQPVDNISNLYHFHSCFRKRLLESGKCRSTEIQLNLWPLYTWNLSCTVISPSASGKTAAYVLALLNKFWLGGYIQPKITADKMIPKSSPLFRSQRIFGSKIFAIILTDSMFSVIQIGKEFQKWLRVLVGMPAKSDVDVPEKTETFSEHDQDQGQRNQQKRNQYSIRINQLHEKSSVSDYFDVLNGCAVLIATTEALAKLIKMNLISLNDNKVLIIDRADDFINAGHEVAELFTLATGQHNFLTNKQQTLVFAQNWTDDIKRFFFDVQIKPILLLKSMVDATILFQQARASIELTETLQLEQVERIVLELTEMPKFERVYAAVICRDYSQITEIANFLRSSKRIDRDLLQIFPLKQQSTAIDNNEIVFKLLSYSPNINKVKLVLLTSDDILDFALYFRRFNCLIHLDRMDDPKEDFVATLNARFVLIFDNLIGEHGNDAPEGLWQIQQLNQLRNSTPGSGSVNAGLKLNDILNYFVLVRSDYAQKEQRLKQVVIDLLDYCDQLMVNRQQPLKYGSEHTTTGRYRDYMNDQMADYIREVIEADMCPQFAAFAKCRKMDQKIQCWKGRHTLRHCLTESATSGVVVKHGQALVEANSQIKFRISHVVDTNQFYIQLLSVRSFAQLTGEWMPTNDHHELLRLRGLLARYKQMRHLTKFKVISTLTIGQLYAFFDYDDMLRVRLVKIHSSSEELPIWISPGKACKMNDEEIAFFKCNVEVLAIDFGRTIHTKAYNLIQLNPSHPDTELLLAGIPPLAYRIYMADVAAPNGEYSWDSGRLSNLASIISGNILLQMDGSSEDNYLTGWILARSDNTLWLHSVILSKRLHNLGVMQNTYLAQNMIQNGLAIANDRRFEGCDYETHRRVASFWRSNIQRKHVRFQWFNSSDSSDVPTLHNVFITNFVDLHQLYVIREDLMDKLTKLEVKWAKELKRAVTSNNRPVISVILHHGQLCFLLVKEQSNQKEKLQMKAKRCQISSINLPEKTCRIMLLDYGLELTGISLDKIYQMEDNQIFTFPYQAIQINLRHQFDYEYTEQGQQSLSVIRENLEKLSAVIQLDPKVANTLSMNGADSSQAKINSVDSVHFARCYNATMFVYRSEVDQLNWNFVSSQIVNLSAEEPIDDTELYIYDEVPVNLVAFLMEHQFLNKTTDYDQLLAMRPSYQIWEDSFSDDDSNEYDYHQSTNQFSIDSKLSSQDLAAQLFQMLRARMETPVARPHDDDILDDEKGESEIAQEGEKDITPSNRSQPFIPHLLSAIEEEDEEEEMEDYIAQLDSEKLTYLLHKEDPDLLKDILLNPDDLSDNDEQLRNFDSDIEEEDNVIEGRQDVLYCDSDKQMNMESAESGSDLEFEDDQDHKVLEEKSNDNKPRRSTNRPLDKVQPDGYFDFDQFIPL